MAAKPQEEQAAAFGARVNQRRVELGLSVVTAARGADVSPSTWTTIEKGGRTLRGEWVTPQTSDRILVRIAQVLELPPAEVFEAAGRPVNAALWERHLSGRGASATAGSVDFEPTIAERVSRLEEQMAEVRDALVEQGRRQASAKPGR